MALITRQMLAVVLVVLALIAVNLLVDVGLIYILSERRLPNWIGQAMFGVLASQVILTGLWLGLGDGRWYLRLVVAIPLTMSVAKTIGWAEALSATAQQQGEEDRWAMIAFMLIAMMLATSLLAFVLRRTRSWRLTGQKAMSLPPTRQFQIGDTMLWTIVISGALAAVKFLMSLDENFGQQILDLALVTIRTAAVGLAALRTAFTTRRLLRAFIVLTIVVLLVGAAFAIPDAYQYIQRMRASATTPVALLLHVSAAMNHAREHEVFAIAAALATLMNCFVLRALGCQLIRPGTNEASLK